MEIFPVVRVAIYREPIFADTSYFGLRHISSRMSTILRKEATIFNLVLEVLIGPHTIVDENI